MTTLAVEAHDVSIALAGRPVVRRVDLSVAAGELVAVLGTNGSGKSTLVRGLMGLVPLTTGRVDLLGTPLARFRSWRRVGYVPQRSTASSGVPATVREVVTSGRLSRRPYAGWPTRADRRAVDDALAHVALADRARDSVTQLSGGQQQRAMIARALATEPDLLVMDEPTAGVDQRSQEVLAELVGSLLGAGTSVVLVAHQLGPVARLVDRVVVLGDGRVVFMGAAEEAERSHQLAHDHPHTSAPEDGSGLTGEGMWR